MVHRNTTQTWHQMQGIVMAHGILVLAKMGIGFMTGAVTLITDGLHSGINLVSTAAGYTAERRKNTFSDTLRQYGEEQADRILSCMEAVLLIAASILILSESIQRFSAPRLLPGAASWGFGLMAATALVQAGIAQVMQKIAVIHESAAYFSAAQDARRDVWLAAGIATGFAVMKITGWLWIDAVLAVGISFYLLYSGIKMLWEDYNGFRAIPINDIEKHRIGRIILDNPGVLGYHKLQVRTEHAAMKLSFHLEVSKDLPIYKAYAVSDAVSMSLLLKYGSCVPSIHLDRK